MTVWVLTREFSDSDTCLIVGVFSSQEKAEAAMAAEANPDPMYGQLDIGEWTVDA